MLWWKIQGGKVLSICLYSYLPRQASAGEGGASTPHTYKLYILLEHTFGMGKVSGVDEGSRRQQKRVVPSSQHYYKLGIPNWTFIILYFLLVRQIMQAIFAFFVSLHCPTGMVFRLRALNAFSVT